MQPPWLTFGVFFKSSVRQQTARPSEIKGFAQAISALDSGEALASQGKSGSEESAHERA